jgi:hypothetical protein
MGNVYFYNLTASTVSLSVNGFNGDTIKPLPGAPYTPNTNQNTYTRYDTAQPQQNQFGTRNAISYKLDGGASGAVDVEIDVDFGRYPAVGDLLVYLYSSAVVVMSPTDSVPYLGKNSETINVGPGSLQQV